MALQPFRLLNLHHIKLSKGAQNWIELNKVPEIFITKQCPRNPLTNDLLQIYKTVTIIWRLKR